MTPGLTVPITQRSNPNDQPQLEMRSSWHGSSCEGGTNYTRRSPVFNTHWTTRGRKNLKRRYARNLLTISMSLVTELARSETEELASVRRLLSSGVWPLGLPPCLLPAGLRQKNKSATKLNTSYRDTLLYAEQTHLFLLSVPEGGDEHQPLTFNSPGKETEQKRVQLARQRPKGCQHTWCEECWEIRGVTSERNSWCKRQTWCLGGNDRNSHHASNTPSEFVSVSTFLSHSWSKDHHINNTKTSPETM